MYFKLGKRKCLLFGLLYVNFFYPFLRLPQGIYGTVLPAVLNQVLKVNLLGNEKPRNLQTS